MNIYLFDEYFISLFNSVNILHLFTSNKGDSLTFCSCTPRTTNTMYITFRVLWYISIDNKINSIEIESTTCHISCDKNLSLIFFEGFDGIISISLSDITMNSKCLKSHITQLICQFISSYFCLSKYKKFLIFMLLNILC